MTALKCLVDPKSLGNNLPLQSWFPEVLMIEMNKNSNISVNTKLPESYTKRGRQRKITMRDDRDSDRRERY